MIRGTHHQPHRVVMLAALALVGAGPPAVGASVVLSDNLSNASGGTEAATGSTWLSASFGPDGSGATLDSVTLLLANPVAGTASLSLYTDGGLQPGSLAGTFTSPGSYSSSLAGATFTTSGIALAANSTYWIVLSATSGEFDWSWTSNNAGSGAGFQGTWGLSPDAGTTWFTDNLDPTQFRVTATTAAVATPAPSSMILFGPGAAALLLYHLRRRRRSDGRRATPPIPAVGTA